MWATFALAAAFVLGAYLRLQQLGAQVLIDDEWHAVHQVLNNSPARMLVDFGFSDYSIPLGLLAWGEAHVFGLSETLLRLPMVLCGLATLVVFPAYIARRLSPATAVVFAVLLALSPLLVIYSRMARPYAITIFLCWVAHAAFARYAATTAGARGPAALYVLSASLAAWLHPIIAPFVVAPFLWHAMLLLRAPAGERWRMLRRLVALAIPAGLVMAALVLPPLFANLESMALKSGVHAPTMETAIGVWYAWLGTPSTAVVVACLVFALCGAGPVLRALPEARTGALGIVLTLAAVMVSRPTWSFNPITLGRYLLPVVPLLLVSVAAGAVRLASVVARLRIPGHRFAAAVVAALPCVGLAAQSPLLPMLRQPNGETQHFVHHFDFRPDHNAYLPHMAEIPLSPFWATLAAEPAGSLRIAVAPFYFESYDWDAPRWEAVSGQAVVPGYLWGLCVDARFGEVPPERAFRFANAVHLADAAALARKGIDYVVWQKPYQRVVAEQTATVGAETAKCEVALRARYDAPAFEDGMLIAFRVARAQDVAGAGR